MRRLYVYLSYLEIENIYIHYSNSSSSNHPHYPLGPLCQWMGQLLHEQASSIQLSAGTAGSNTQAIHRILYQRKVTKKSPKRHQKFTKSSPKGYRKFTKRSPKCHQKVTKRSLKGRQKVSESSTKGHWKFTEMSLKSYKKVTKRSLKGYPKVKQMSLSSIFWPLMPFLAISSNLINLQQFPAF